VKHPWACVLAALTFVLASCVQPRVENRRPAAPARVIGYYFGPTASRGFPVSNVRGQLLTHINYAFGEIRPDGTAALASPLLDSVNFAALRDLKQRYPHLQVLISFGGWTGSKYFSEAALPQNRARFIASIINTFLLPFPGVFDGVDLDWEYPVRGGVAGIINRPEDRENLTALIGELRVALDRVTPAKHYLITIAAPAGAGHLVKYEMPKLAEMLDFINVMTYDFHTAGSKIAHYNSPLAATRADPTPQYNIEESIKAFVGAGVPRDKLVVGVPFYGHGFAGVSAKDHGRLQTVEGVANDSGGVRPKWVGGIRYYQIADAIAEGYRRYWDKQAKVPWLYNAAARIFITYDDARSLSAKAKFVRKNRLGGIMIWELSGDDGTLLPVLNKELRR